MNLKNFNELLSLFENKANIQNISYKKQTGEDEDSAQYEAIMKFLQNDCKSLTNKFKKALITFLNNSFNDICNSHFMEDFFIIESAILTNFSLRYQKKVHNLPYGFKDSDKYVKRVNSLKRYSIKKEKPIIIFPLSPYEHIKFFMNKANDLIDIQNIQHNFSTKRDIIEYKNEIILDFVEVILSDNYAKQSNRKMRKTYKNKLQYIETIEIFKQALKKKEKILTPKF